MKFYSKSQKREVEVSEAKTPHLTNLKAKILRGEYRDANDEPLSAGDEMALLQEIDGVLATRAELEGARVEE